MLINCQYKGYFVDIYVNSLFVARVDVKDTNNIRVKYVESSCKLTDSVLMELAYIVYMENE